MTPEECAARQSVMLVHYVGSVEIEVRASATALLLLPAVTAALPIILIRCVYRTPYITPRL